MEITLEKIELVKDRTGVGYKEAKDALEQTNGSVVDAIILIEDTINASAGPEEEAKGTIIDNIKEVIRKGNVSKIVIRKNDEVILNLPVSIGIVGTVIFPWAAVLSTVAALGTKCTVELVKEDGTAVDVSSKAGDVIEKAKDKGSIVFDEVKDKGGDIFDVAKDKGGDIFDAVKDKGGDFVDIVKDKGGDFIDAAKDKVKDVKDTAETEFTVKENDFDLSDLDLDEMDEE